jgi:hypothetical protein
MGILKLKDNFCCGNQGFWLRCGANRGLEITHLLKQQTGRILMLMLVQVLKIEPFVLYWYH